MSSTGPLIFIANPLNKWMNDWAQNLNINIKLVFGVHFHVFHFPLLCDLSSICKACYFYTSNQFPWKWGTRHEKSDFLGNNEKNTCVTSILNFNGSLHEIALTANMQEETFSWKKTKKLLDIWSTTAAAWKLIIFSFQHYFETR